MDHSHGPTTTVARHQFLNICIKSLDHDKKTYPMFHLGGKAIQQEQKTRYLGLWFETGCKFLWREQYRVKSRKASKVTIVILGLDRFVGSLLAWDLRTLYMARVDPYLTARCEVCLDIEDKSLKFLEKVQMKFLRQMLGMGSRSMKAVLFSETGSGLSDIDGFIWHSKICAIGLAWTTIGQHGMLSRNHLLWHTLKRSPG